MQNPFDPGYYTEDEARTFGFKSVGRNVRIAKNAQIIGLDRITIGDNVRIDGFTNIIAAGGPGVTIGSYIHIGAYCHFSGSGGGVTLRDFVNLSQGVRIYSGSDDYSGESLTSPMTPKHLKKETIGPVVVGRHVIIGSGTVVLPTSRSATTAPSAPCRWSARRWHPGASMRAFPRGTCAIARASFSTSRPRCGPSRGKGQGLPGMGDNNLLPFDQNTPPGAVGLWLRARSCATRFCELLPQAVSRRVSLYWLRRAYLSSSQRPSGMTVSGSRQYHELFFGDFRPGTILSEYLAGNFIYAE